MESASNYLSINKNSWNNKVDTHVQSDFYNMAGFLQGQTSLNSIELALLGDLKGKKVLHLQCHFGQDTISLSRLGAEVIGVDFSDTAIQKAQELAEITGSTARFVCCDVYNSDQFIHEKFDYVFTSYGTIGWLPDLNRWAELINHFLLPGGQFVFVEFHPVVWMFDDKFENVAYNYFMDSPIIEAENGTYADKNAAISQIFVTWNHSLSEVIMSLKKNKLDIKDFQEYDYSPYQIFGEMTEVETKKYRITKLHNRLPLVYSILAIKSE